jgi:hypothetical protein
MALTLMPCAAIRRGAIATRAERQAFSLNRSAPRGYKLT